MENKKPNVFPQGMDMKSAINEANEVGTKIAEQFEKENEVKNVHKTQGELNAQEQMRLNSIDQLEAQLARREEALARRRREEEGSMEPEPEVVTSVSYASHSEPKYEAKDSHIEKEKATLDDIYERLSRPQVDVPYDALKLPSGGLLYKNHKSTLDVAYLNATDEDIITNPNLLQSGKFLEVLINRKLMNTKLKYRDLHVGDRNAIMLWLRSTAYGSAYNITLSDPKDPEYKEFQVTIDLDKIPMKPLGEKPNSDGLFEYILPISKNRIKFKLLTVGDVEDIEAHLEEIDSDFTDISSFTLKKQVVSYNKGVNVEGEFKYLDENEVYDRVIVDKFAERIVLGDVRSLRKYIDKIESGMDMNITVRTPGGESITTFLPLNTSFFWPDL